MTTSPAFWDRIAPRYAKSPVRDQGAYKTTLERVRNYLASTDTVLEIGCGTGSTALSLADAVQDYTATDYAPGMIAIAEGKDRPGNVTFRKAPALDTLAPAQHYDAILAFNLFHLVENPELAIQDAHRRLKPGGYLISKTPCLAEGGIIYRIVVGAMRLVRKAPFVGFLSVEGYDRMIEDAGFAIVETGNYPAKPPSRFVVARKM